MASIALSSCAEALVEPHAGSGAWGNSGRCTCLSMRSMSRRAHEAETPAGADQEHAFDLGGKRGEELAVVSDLC